MDIPDWIDTDIVYSVGYWVITLGTMLAFMIGFKLADTGLLGVNDIGLTIPLMSKILLLLLTPIVSYLVSKKVFG